MKKRTGLFLTLIVICALLLGLLIVRRLVRDSLEPQVRSAAAAFRNGVLNADGSTSESLSDALQQRMNAADGLLNLAAKHDEVYSEYTNLRTACNALLELEKNNGDFAEMKAADAGLASAFETCRDALAPLLSGKESETLAKCENDLNAAADAVHAAAEAYNASVRAFRSSTLDRFPNSILKVFLKEREIPLWPE